MDLPWVGACTRDGRSLSRHVLEGRSRYPRFRYCLMLGSDCAGDRDSGGPVVGTLTLLSCARRQWYAVFIANVVVLIIAHAMK